MPGIFQMCQACLGKAWSRSGNTAPIVSAPDGGPQSRMGLSLPKEHSAALSHSQPGLHCQGRAGDVFPSWHNQELGLVLQDFKLLLDPILMSDWDSVRALELVSITHGPKQGNETCVWYHQQICHRFYWIWQMSNRAINCENVMLPGLNNLLGSIGKSYVEVKKSLVLLLTSTIFTVYHTPLLLEIK